MIKVEAERKKIVKAIRKMSEIKREIELKIERERERVCE